MNEVINVINNRRSTRVFKDEPIKEEHKNIIIEAAINAPTAGNMMLYNIIDVTNQELIDKLSVLCDNQPFMKNAKLVLLFVTNSNRWYDAYNKLNNANYKPTLSDYYLGLNDAIIACQNAVIAAESLNIGSCYIGDIVENYEEIKEIFKLPKYVNPACLAVFGYKVNEENLDANIMIRFQDNLDNEIINNITSTTNEKFNKYIYALDASSGFRFNLKQKAMKKTPELKEYIKDKYKKK